MKNKYIIIFSTALIIILLDQITKFLIKINFKLNESLSIIKNIYCMVALAAAIGGARYHHTHLLAA